MGIEIERKFLVREKEWELALKRQHHMQVQIRQGYLTSNPTHSVRIRIITLNPKEKTAKITTKIGSGLTRKEFEYNIPVADAEEMLEDCVGGTITKTRYTILHQTDIWAVDVHEGPLKGLITAEIELESERQVFDKPPWVDYEVTGNDNFANTQLATVNLSTWEEPKEKKSMNTIKSVFGRDRVFLPVIHPVTLKKAYESVTIAVKAGADGIFLIDQGMDGNAILELANDIRIAYPELWIGINLLSRHPQSIFEAIAERKLQGIWKDSIFPAEGEEASVRDLTFHNTINTWEGLFFGGVAFKYQPPVKDLPTHLQRAVKQAHVITTSGVATGKAADTTKIQEFRTLLKDHDLALASGVTIDNVDSYLPYVNAYLVGTGIEDSFGSFNFDKTQELAERIHNYDN